MNKLYICEVLIRDSSKAWVGIPKCDVARSTEDLNLPLCSATGYFLPTYGNPTHRNGAFTVLGKLIQLKMRDIQGTVPSTQNRAIEVPTNPQHMKFKVVT